MPTGSAGWTAPLKPPEGPPRPNDQPVQVPAEVTRPTGCASPETWHGIRTRFREQAVRHGEIRRLALAVRAGRHALAANRAQLQTIVDQMAPGLTRRRGIGAVTAAQAIVSFSRPGRCRSDAAFAALSGTSPLQASSGKTVRHRLNRGGDRALNSAIHTIAITRMRCCPPPRTTSPVAQPKASPAVRSNGASSATSPASSTAPSTPAPRSPPRHRQSNGRLTNIEASEGWGF
jgi:hypothetical protein